VRTTLTAHGLQFDDGDCKTVGIPVVREQENQEILEELGRKLQDGNLVKSSSEICPSHIIRRLEYILPKASTR
jgi:hypothetical protein